MELRNDGPLDQDRENREMGNSAAVRLPSSLLDRAGLRRDEPVEIAASENEIVIRRGASRVKLDDLLARFDPEKHRHELMLDVAPVGRETI